MMSENSRFILIGRCDTTLADVWKDHSLRGGFEREGRQLSRLHPNHLP
jgi:hypothetical protein